MSRSALLLIHPAGVNQVQSGHVKVAAMLAAAVQGISEAIGELGTAGSAMAYIAVMLCVAAEALVPILPGETAVVTAATFASQGDLSIIWVFVAAWAGALIGDVFLYVLGRTGSERITRWAEKAIGVERLDSGRYFFTKYGQPFLVVGRFIPGLRVVNALTAGALDLPTRRYLAAEIPGAGLWALYASWLGYAVGQRLDGNVWLSLAVSGLATVILTAIVGVFWKKAEAQRKAETAAEAQPESV